jgi:hypothetical protein
MCEKAQSLTYLRNIAYGIGQEKKASSSSGSSISGKELSKKTESDVMAVIREKTDSELWTDRESSFFNADRTKLSINDVQDLS